MPKASLVDSIPPEFIERVNADLVASQRWGDKIVTAWLERRDGHFEWHSVDYWIQLEASTEGRSILYGETLVTRADDGFIALVNGKRFRDRFIRFQLSVLGEALARLKVPAIVVRPPYSTDFVSAEDLDAWYKSAKPWQGLEPEAYVQRYMRIAEDLVSCFVGDSGRYDYNDGYFVAHARPQTHIWAAVECIATKAPIEPFLALLSGRRYAHWSHHRSLRDTVRIVLEHNGIPFREVRPRDSDRTSPSSLIARWNADRLTLLK